MLKPQSPMDNVLIRDMILSMRLSKGYFVRVVSGQSSMLVAAEIRKGIYLSIFSHALFCLYLLVKMHY